MNSRSNSTKLGGRIRNRGGRIAVLAIAAGAGHTVALKNDGTVVAWGANFFGLTNVPAGFNPGPHSGLPSSASGSISGAFYLTNQCVACHMQPDAAPATTHSHAFTPGYNVCLNCHDGPAARAALTPYLSNQVATVIFVLNLWADTQTNSRLSTNGVVAWEYTTPGGLILQTNSLGYATGWIQLLCPATVAGAASHEYRLPNERALTVLPSAGLKSALKPR